MVKDHGEGVEKHDFNVKNNEDHGDEVEADVEALLGVADGIDAGFVGRFLGGTGALGAQ